MKNGRVNERNIGNITLSGELKRRNKKTKLQKENIQIVFNYLCQVQETMRQENGIYYDSLTEFTFTLTRTQLSAAWEVLENISQLLFESEVAVIDPILRQTLENMEFAEFNEVGRLNPQAIYALDPCFAFNLTLDEYIVFCEALIRMCKKIK